MFSNIPNLFTWLRILLIPVFVAVFYLPDATLAPQMKNLISTGVFLLAAATDWLDGYLARRLGQYSSFGAFLDPVADKLMVAAALVVLLADPRIQTQVLDTRLFTIVALVILGREIAVSALREWMAEIGHRSSVAVSVVGKFKTASQMLATGFLLWREPLAGLPILRIGEGLLYVAAGLTLWSMLVYLRAAWPTLTRQAP